MSKKRIVLITIIIGILLLIIYKTNIIAKIYSNINTRLMASELEDAISYRVYDNQDNNNIKVLVKFSVSSPIEYIIKPDGSKINANGKNEIAIDHSAVLNQEEIFKIKLVNGQEVENKMLISEDDINNYFNIEDVTDSDYLNSIKINYNELKSGEKIYYKVGKNNTTWTQYNIGSTVSIGTLDIEEYDSMDTDSNKGITTIGVKRVDSAGNVVYSNNQFEVRIINTAIPDLSLAAQDTTLVAKYGEVVNGYTPAGGGTWRLFYADRYNIYLLRDYDSSLRGSCQQKNEAITEIGRALNPMFTNWTSTNANVKSTKWLTNPDYWNTNYKSGNALWSVGGTSLEMFTLSYNATHKGNPKTLSLNINRNTLDYTTMEGNYAKLLGRKDTLDNTLYFGQCSSWQSFWLSSPMQGESDNSGIACAYANTQTNYGQYLTRTTCSSNGVWIRPLVCYPKQYFDAATMTVR